LLDTSLCSDDITVVPNIQEDQEMHFELELVVVTRALDKTDLSPEEASSYIVGYTLAVTSSVHPLGNESSEPGPGYHRELLHHPADSIAIDAWCPFGATLVTPSMLPDPDALRVQAVVNGLECDVKSNRPCLGSVQKYAAASFRYCKQVANPQFHRSHGQARFPISWHIHDDRTRSRRVAETRSEP
jgi:2-keto-4-pentenoate hydratase/2-oxohepta-3-ene-1,7-dioic acid hydratase in catechol pathway